MHRTRIPVGAAVAVVAVVVTACGTSSVDPSKGTSSATAPSGSSGAASTSGSASASTSAGTALSVSAKVEKMKGNVLVLVPLTVSGKKSMFVLDSGATVTVLDSAFAKTAGLDPRAVNARTKTLGCSPKIAATQVDDWSLVGKALPASKLPTQNLGFGSAKVGGLPIGGLLGADVQAAAKVVTIDYAGQHVTFGGGDPSGGRAIPLKVLTKAAAVVAIAPVTVGGRSLQMVVDTGASRTTLANATVAQLHLAKAGSAVSVNAAGCPAKAQPVRLTGAKLGGVAVPDAVVSGTAQGTPSVPSAVGLFGSDLLSTYKTITIDYAGSKLILGG